MSDIDEKQLVLYAQMANLVNLILDWPDINIKEIARNFSKVSYMTISIDYIVIFILLLFIAQNFVFFFLIDLFHLPFFCITKKVFV